MRIIFAGTPDFAARALAAILRSRHEVVLVFTQPDRPAGRGLHLQASPVKTLAEAHAIAVRQPRTLKDPQQWPALREKGADILVVAAYGLILPQAVLDIPPLGAVNIHASLLPRWRGAAPIHRAILAGDQQTGISIMQMDAGLDTGPVLMTEATPIAAEDTTQSLHDRLADIGARLVVTALDRLEAGELKPLPQPAEGVTYASKVDKAEALIDWASDAESIDRKVRALNPAPGARTLLRGTELKLWKTQPLPSAPGSPGELTEVTKDGLVVACGRGSLRLLEVQRAGGRKLAAAEFVRGLELRAGEVLGV